MVHAGWRVHLVFPIIVSIGSHLTGLLLSVSTEFQPIDDRVFPVASTAGREADSSDEDAIAVAFSLSLGS